MSEIRKLEHSPEIVMAMVIDVKRGKTVEEVVDHYVVCKTPELRKKLIDGLNEIVGNWLIYQALK